MKNNVKKLFRACGKNLHWTCKEETLIGVDTISKDIWIQE